MIQLTTVNANTIAMEEIGRAITNMVMLGALIKATEMIDPDGVERIIERRFGPMVGGRNIKAFRRALVEALYAPYPTWPFHGRSKISSTVLEVSGSLLIGLLTAAIWQYFFPAILTLLFHTP